MVCVATCASLLSPLASQAQGVSPALAGPLEWPPLSSVRLTGGYGEMRSNHFHAGLDLSTGGQVGAAVRAPLPCSVERVRASGVGYGRSLYLRAHDGRLLVFGHLDAFAPAVAAWVDSAQRASGQYEQDLWPASGRFTHAAGDTVAWSGESGAGPPHLHFEIRHEDFALNPLRAGVVLADDGAPVIESVTFEPLSFSSRVERRASPFTWRPGMRETLVVQGAVRAIVRARSGLAGAGDVPAWSTAIEWSRWFIEARLDSISWAGEMSQVDWLVDRGRISGSGGMILWAGGIGARPRFLRTNVPEGMTGGDLKPAVADSATVLRVIARDVNGRESTRTLYLRAPRAGEAGPDGVDASTATREHASEPRWEFFPLPDGHALRVRVSAVPRGLRDVHIARLRESVAGGAATFDGGSWSAIVAATSIPDADGFVIRAVTSSGAAWERRCDVMLWPTGTDGWVMPAEFARFSLPLDGVYERSLVTTRVLRPAGGAGLVALTPVVQVLPQRLPLSRPAPVGLRLPQGASASEAGLYRRPPGGEWEFVRAKLEADGRWLRAETSSLGEFAILRDVTAPEVKLLTPARRAPGAPYPRWQLVASVRDAGSGIESSQTCFVVDGRDVPSEWDPEQRQLRWRPLSMPAPGLHRYEVRATDRAGHRTRRAGTFVLASAPH